jgi:hypothetical protein
MEQRTRPLALGGLLGRRDGDPLESAGLPQPVGFSFFGSSGTWPYQGESPGDGPKAFVLDEVN